MHHATVLLGRAQVAGVFEGHPGVAGLKDHAQHFAPQVLCLQRFMELEFAISRHLLVLLVALLERGAVKIMQVRHVVGGEQGPVAILEYPLHKQIGDPVGGIHVVCASTVITGVLAQVEELLDIHVPGF